MKTPLQKLVDWYVGQCNDHWEHEFGFTIESLDNPGVCVKIDLKDTSLENVPFHDKADKYTTDCEWISCYKRGSEFNGVGAPDRIDDIINIFLEWVEDNKPQNQGV